MTAIAGGFPGDLFVILAGVTFVFAITKNNGTIDWLIRAGVQPVRGRVTLIPWIMFMATAVLTVGALLPPPRRRQLRRPVTKFQSQPLSLQGCC